MASSRALAVLVVVAACAVHCSSSGGGAPPPTPPPCGSPDVTCTKTEAVASAIRLPAKRTDSAVDLDGDGVADDALGDLLGTLASAGFTAQTSEDQKVADGTAILLVDESSVDPALATDSGAALVHLVTGASQASPDYSGAGAFTADPAQAPAPFVGPIAGGVFTSPAAPTVTAAPHVAFTLALGDTTATMPLYVAHVEVTSVGGEAVKAQINGSFKATDMKAIFVPALAASLTKTIAADPGSSTAAQLESLFDAGNCQSPDGSSAAAGDHVIAACELSGNTLFAATLAPDVQLFGADGGYHPTPHGTQKDALSAAFTLTLAGARF